MAHRAPAGIAERRAAILGTEPALEPLAAGLRRRGIAVATIPAGQAGYDDALDQAAATVGHLDAVVWAATPAGLGVPVPIIDLDPAAWDALVGGGLRSYVEFLQAAHRRLQASGGRIVVVIPTIAMSGAANLTAWSTVAEGQRALAKSVARVWGADGITVNCVAVPTSLLAGSEVDLDRPALQRSALADPQLDPDVAGVIATLCAEDLAVVTGTTVGVDGGRWIPS